MGHHLGIDIGSTTIKIVLLDNDFNSVHSMYQRHYSDIALTFRKMLNEIMVKFDSKSLSVTITGSAGISVAEWLGVDFIQEVLACNVVIERFFPEIDVAIE